MGLLFDTIAEDYDRWYDTDEGRALFLEERDCLLAVCPGPFAGWLEVGVGTGRFAEALGVPIGVDPSPRMLAIAARRGVQGLRGAAECLPFAEAAFEGVLLALTLAFVANASRAFRECYRVLRPGGRLLLGVIPAESAWGEACRKKGVCGHPVYARARFRTTDEVTTLARSAGFNLLATADALRCPPGGMQHTDSQAPGGFLAQLYTR